MLAVRPPASVAASRRAVRGGVSSKLGLQSLALYRSPFPSRLFSHSKPPLYDSKPTVDYLTTDDPEMPPDNFDSPDGEILDWDNPELADDLEMPTEDSQIVYAFTDRIVTSDRRMKGNDRNVMSEAGLSSDIRPQWGMSHKERWVAYMKKKHEKRLERSNSPLDLNNAPPPTARPQLMEANAHYDLSAKPRDYFTGQDYDREQRTIPPNGSIPVLLKKHFQPLAPESKPERPPPIPSKYYLAQASKPPVRATLRQPLLVVLDLNGTLIDRHKKGLPLRYTPRPGLHKFLSTLLERYRVLVWSSARPNTVDAVCRAVFGEKRRSHLLGEWGREMFGLSQKDYNSNIQVYKTLSTVWRDEGIQWKYSPRRITFFHDKNLYPDIRLKELPKRDDFPSWQYGWDQTNTVLLDDSILKAASEPFNCIEIPTFVRKTRSDEEEVAILDKVVDLLESLSRHRDVSATLHKWHNMVENDPNLNSILDIECDTEKWHNLPTRTYRRNASLSPEQQEYFEGLSRQKAHKEYNKIRKRRKKDAKKAEKAEANKTAEAGIAEAANPNTNAGAGAGKAAKAATPSTKPTKPAKPTKPTTNRTKPTKRTTPTFQYGFVSSPQPQSKSPESVDGGVSIPANYRKQRKQERRRQGTTNTTPTLPTTTTTTNTMNTPTPRSPSPVSSIQSENFLLDRLEKSLEN
ncbi:HAD-like protein [Aspergillus ellipticus CBS 707.79]|uniref:HAD-like protein n=1 Tax=Aspergillus ellipticus CBS 707.79 TaxID=1448320 RepID=A0A319DQJ5_9EURO|nr:HAD-like protein [Aspergillus ellipticus CBS 707.79]